MPDVVDGEIVKDSIWKRDILKPHSTYFSYVWITSYMIAGAYAFFAWLGQLFNAAQEGIVQFALVLIFQFVIQAITGLLAACVLFLFFIAVTAIPYLIVRGLIKP